MSRYNIYIILILILAQNASKEKVLLLTFPPRIFIFYEIKIRWKNHKKYHFIFEKLFFLLENYIDKLNYYSLKLNLIKLWKLIW